MTAERYIRVFAGLFIMVALTLLTVFGLCLATVRGLRNGSLWAPESVVQLISSAG